MSEEDVDPWEEEIDLREVARGILNKWYVWIGIPFLITLVSGIYFFLPTADTYLLEGTLVVNYDQPELQKLNVNLPPRGVVYNHLRDASLLRPYIKKEFSFETEEELNKTVNSLLASIKFKTPPAEEKTTSDQPIYLRFKTSQPDTYAPALQYLLAEFKKQEEQNLKQLLAERKKALKRRETFLQQEWTTWESKWNKLTGDTFPPLLESRLQAEKKDYEDATAKLSEIRSQYNTARASLKKIKSLLKNEPPHFGYRLSPYYALTLQDNTTGASEKIQKQLKEAPSEILNKAYLELRQRRVTLAEKVNSLASTLDQLEEQKSQTGDLLKLSRKLPALKKKETTLRNQRKLLQKHISSVENNLARANYLLTQLPDFLEIYPPEPPGKLLANDQNKARNTLLAGAVSFLLLFFGTAFWEII